MTRMWSASLAACIVLTPSSGVAQASGYATVTVSSTQTYEDNLFAASRSAAQARDLTVRLGPAFEAGYLSTPLTFVARYAFDAERYLDYTSLSRGFARQDAVVHVLHRPTRRLALEMKTSYAESHNPRDFNVDSGLAVGRGRAERLAAVSTAAYEWTPLTRVNLEYAFTQDAFAGGFATDVRSARVGLERHGAAGRGRRLDYRFQHFSFGDRGSSAWHVVTAGWSRDITRRIAIEFAVGPRVSGGRIRPELEAIVSRVLQKGELSASYSRTQATAIGEPGPIDVQRIAASIVYRPARRVTLNATPAFATSSRGATHASVYGIDVGASGQTRRGLAVVLSGYVGLQRGTLTGRREEIPYRRLSLGFVATLPRVVRAPRAGESR